MVSIELRRPGREELPSYVDALRRGWSPNTLDDEAGLRQLVEIERDADSFLASLAMDHGSTGTPVTLPDGSMARRIPGYDRWIWDGEFSGRIGFRWQLGTEELPPHVLGHVGYAVVPWKRDRGYASEALHLLLDDVADTGLRWIEVTTDPDNVASQRVIEKVGGEFVERFRYPAAYGGGDGLRYRITTGR
jgi:predicted acetyltransferase